MLIDAEGVVFTGEIDLQSVTVRMSSARFSARRRAAKGELVAVAQELVEDIEVALVICPCKGYKFKKGSQKKNS